MAELLSGAAKSPISLSRTLGALTVFGVAFGYVEAAVVVYLRAAYEPLHQQLYPSRAPGDLLPFIPLERVAVPGAGFINWTATELGREAATLAMLAGAALAVARTFRAWFAAFVFTFGLWDVFYYVFLKALIDWPGSLLTWDVLFLVPVPWTAPVLAPLLVALAMVACGMVTLRREALGRPLRLTGRHWLALTAGGLLLLGSFCWEHETVAGGGMPGPFPWPLYTAGLLVALAAFTQAVWRSGPSTGAP